MHLLGSGNLASDAIEVLLASARHLAAAVGRLLEHLNALEGLENTIYE